MQPYYPPPQAPNAAPYYTYYIPGFDPHAWQLQQQRRAAARQITREANWLGAGMLLSLGVGLLVQLLFPLLTGWLLPGMDQASIQYEALEYAVYSPASILLVFWIACRATRLKLSQVVAFGRHNAGIGLACVMFGFAWIALGNFTATVIGELFPTVYENVEQVSGADAATWQELGLQILYVAAIPALVEEFAFRGVVLGVLRRYGDGFAIVASSLLFGLVHGNFIQIPFAFFTAVALGYAVVRTGSLVPAIVLHFLNNAASCVISFIEPHLTDEQDLLFSLLLYVGWLVLGLVGYLILRLAGHKRLTAYCRPYEGCLTPGGRTGAFYRSPTIIVSMVLYVGTALTLSF